MPDNPVPYDALGNACRLTTEFHAMKMGRANFASHFTATTFLDRVTGRGFYMVHVGLTTKSLNIYNQNVLFF